MLLVALISLRFPATQTFLARKLTAQLSKDLNTYIHVDRVNIHPFSNVFIEDITVVDLYNDTILKTQSLDISIWEIRLKKNTIDLESVTLNKADIKLIKPKNQKGFSFQFILDHFDDGKPKKKEKQESFTITGRELNLKDCNLYFIDKRSSAEYSGMDYTDLAFKNINLSLSYLKNVGTQTTAIINHLSVNEKSGANIDHLAGKLSIDTNYIRIDSLTLKTNKSLIKSKYLAFEFENFDEFESNFEEAVTIKSNFHKSSLHFEDLTYYTSFFIGLDREVELSGKFEGTVANFRTQNLYLKLDKNTSFQGDIAMKGLPYVDSTTFETRIDYFTTTKNELANIELPPFDEKHFITIPKELDSSGIVALNGFAAGNFNDVTGNINLSSNYGLLTTSSRVWFNEKTKNTHFKGNVKTTQLNLAPIIPESKIGKVSGDINTSLIWSKKNGLDANVSGIVKQMYFNGYDYKKILVNGDINEDFFRGKVKAEDQNANFVFDGIVDLRDTIPAFNFKSNITKIDLMALNLTSDSVRRIICGEFTVNGQGNDLDNSYGYALIEDLNYYQDGKEYLANNIEIESSPNVNGKLINLRSSIADATIEGDFTLAELPQCFDFIGSKVVPTLYEDNDSILLSKENFTYNVLIKDYTPIETFFTPGIMLAKNSFITGDFNDENETFSLLFKSKSLTYNGIQFNQIDGFIKKPNEEVTINFDINQLLFTNNLTFNKVLAKTTIENNFIKPSLSWYVNNTDDYGYIAGDGYWYNIDYFDMVILPSYFKYNDVVWKTSDIASLIVNKDDIIFDSLVIQNNKDERIIIDDSISSDPNRLLHVVIEDFGLENINPFLADNGVKYFGTVNARAEIGNIYGNPTIKSEMTIDSLKTNNEWIGDVSFKSEWTNNNEISCDGKLVRNKEKAFDFKGAYRPFEEENSLDIVCKMDNTPVAFANSYLNDDGISDLSGFISGDIKVTGNPKKPILNGTTNLNQVKFNIDYLNTSYYFNGELIVTEDGFLTKDNIKIKDTKGNIATFNGAVFHDNFSDFDFDLSINLPENIYVNGNDKRTYSFPNAVKKKNALLALNTTDRENKDFYGEVYGVGTVNISGYQDELNISIDVKVAKGSKFTYPMYGSNEVTLPDWVNFTSSDSVETDVDLSGISLDMNITATPDAELEIIFDPVLGDKITTRGEGNIFIGINEDSDVEMKGKYTIEEGDYLFTLGLLNFENLLNKKFKVQQGSTITWFGDPAEADININAIYELKASLYDIMAVYNSDKKNEYKNRTDVICYMKLTGNLMKPNIDFAIELPRADQESKTALQNIIQSEEDLNKQVFSLLVLNRFIPPANSISNEDRGGSGAVSTTASELLSNQVSSWLSQLSTGVDIGFNYRPGDNISNDEVALALSTELLNDRLVINSNFGVSSGNDINQNPNSFIGDASVEYKLNKDGTFRIRIFTRTNEFDITQQSQGATTQGAGIFYKKGFNTFEDLFGKP